MWGFYMGKYEKSNEKYLSQWVRIHRCIVTIKEFMPRFTWNSIIFVHTEKSSFTVYT